MMAENNLNPLSQRQAGTGAAQASEGIAYPNALAVGMSVFQLLHTTCVKVPFHSLCYLLGAGR